MHVLVANIQKPHILTPTFQPQRPDGAGSHQLYRHPEQDGQGRDDRTGSHRAIEGDEEGQGG